MTASTLLPTPPPMSPRQQILSMGPDGHAATRRVTWRHLGLGESVDGVHWSALLARGSTGRPKSREVQREMGAIEHLPFDKNQQNATGGFFASSAQDPCDV